MTYLREPVAASMDEVAPAPRREPLQALTGLRIFAALAVYFSHVGAPHGSPEFVETAFASGYYGVTFFFTLSGFVLALNYFDALLRPTVGRLWSYAVARFARVYPLYIVVLTFLLVSASQAGQLKPNWPEHVLLVQAWDPDLASAFSYNGPAWSVGVELFLYAVFPVLVLVIGRLDRGTRPLLASVGAVVVVLAAVAVAFTMSGRADLAWRDPSSAHRWLYRMPFSRVGDFALGVLTARLYLRLRTQARIRRAGPLMAVAAVAATWLLATSPEFLFTPASWDIGYAVPASVLVLGLALAPAGRVAAFLAKPVVVLLGEASYAFYLVQVPAIAGLGPVGWARQSTPATVALQAGQFGVILAIAVGLHVLVEKPARTWVRRLLTSG